MKKEMAAGDNSILLASLVPSDKPPFNLSSIAYLVEFAGKTILLTGDGRSDDIYDGLKENNFLDAAGNLHVDILEMQHHRSHANMSEKFVEKVTADHYVISADGKHRYPDQHILDMILNNINS